MFQAMYLSQHARRMYKPGNGTVPLLATGSRKPLKAELLKSALDTCGPCRSLWGLWWWLL